MPVHDWTRVPAGTYHHFHNAWITHLSDALNDGMLPKGFYALGEQHAGRSIADVLTLHVGPDDAIRSYEGGPVAVAEAPPRVSRKIVASEIATYRSLRRTLTIRHVSGHRVVALVEIVSPANKDRTQSVEDFVAKSCSALREGVHLLIADLLPTTTHDPIGMCGAIWEQIDVPEQFPNAEKPLALAAFVSRPMPDAYFEPIAFGDVLPEMPLFLDVDWYVNTPLERTYAAAYRGVPEIWRAVIEGRSAAV